jgi:hypothetical protein
MQERVFDALWRAKPQPLTWSMLAERLWDSDGSAPGDNLVAQTVCRINHAYPVDADRR